MDRVKQIRRINFEALLRDHKNTAKARGGRGSLKDFALEHEIDQSLASQIKTARREIGDDVARRIERMHTPKLPAGWLDSPHNDHDPSGALEEAFAKLALTLFRRDPRGARAAILAVRSKTSSAKK